MQKGLDYKQQMRNIVQKHVVGERHRAAHIQSCTACPKINIMLSFLKFNLNEKRQENSVGVTFLRRIKNLMNGKCIVFRP